MSGQHTQGRLVVVTPSSQNTTSTYVYVGEPKFGKSPLFFIAGKDHKANARRLAACWNACAHLDTDHIESIAEVGVASVIVTADIHRKDCEAALRELATARALLHELTDIQAPDAGTGAWAELAARVQSYLKGATA